jgi:TRAP transporter TAXI family solute receptor
MFRTGRPRTEPTAPDARRARAGWSLAVTALLLAAGCAQSDPGWQMTIAGASFGGAWSAISEAIANQLRREIPGSSFTHEPGQDGANAELVQQGRVQLALVHSTLARAALAGTLPFDHPQPNVRAVALLYHDAAYHFVVAERTGLDSIEAVKARRFPLRIGVHTRGSLMELASRTALEAYGLSYEDIRSHGGNVFYYPLNETYQMMGDGRMDAAATTLQIPSHQTVEASRGLALRLLPLTEEAIRFCNERLGTERTVIPKGTYPFQHEDVPTFAGRVILITSLQVPDDKVYRITRTLYEHLDELRRAHKSLAPLTLQRLPEVGGVPLHPGAERFYREAGVR